MWLQKGSIGSIEVDGWSIEKGTVKMERSFREKNQSGTGKNSTPTVSVRRNIM